MLLFEVGLYCVNVLPVGPNHLIQLLVMKWLLHCRYQGLTDDGYPKVFEQFLTQHQCNYYCGLLSLRTLKPMDTLQQPPKIKGSRSPLLGRKLGSSSPQHNRKLGSSSPQLQRKGLNSPLTTRKATSSPKVPRKTRETEDNQSTAKPKAEESLKVVVWGSNVQREYISKQLPFSFTPTFSFFMFSCHPLLYLVGLKLGRPAWPWTKCYRACAWKVFIQEGKTNREMS